MTEREKLASRQRIVQQLTQARLEKGVSQAQLAQRIGTQRSNICRMESGTQNLSVDMMIKIAEALDKDIHITLQERDRTMTNVYSIRLYDEDLITFSLEEKGLEGLQSNILYADTQNAHLFPLDLELTNEGIVRWLEKRVIPKNRQFVDEILKTLGLSVNNTKGIMDVCMGLSLNDSYWVVPAGFDGKFADYNLYKNRFSEALSLVAYTGIGAGHEAFSTSPELTTNGMLRKAWRFVDADEIYLYKGGTEGAANTGKEPYSEYYACQIAHTMGIDCVQYDLENWKGILASKCRLFTDIDHSFVPIGRILKSPTLKKCLDYYSRLGRDFYEQLCSMLVFDAVIYNEDRHFGNFGVLRDNHTGEIVAPAPIFDNGLSLFNYAMPEDIKNLKEYAKTRSNPYRISYEEICKEVMGTTQKAQLRRLIDFQFKRHPSINLSEERLTAIEKQIEERVRELLSIPSGRKTKRIDE
ncbi:MAG: helix-turn-helix domain-containing protein [Acutalibacteraceae bacterium]